MCTRFRRQLFARPEIVTLVEWQLLRSCANEGFDLVVYCFMPDHVHILVAGQSPNADVRRLVSTAKQRAAFHAANRFGVAVWQAGFFDRTLRAEETLADVVRYIVNNPVRAGLVPSPREYRFWGSGVYTREEILEFVGRDREPRG